MSTINKLIAFCDKRIFIEERAKYFVTRCKPNLFKIRNKMAKLPKEGMGQDLYIILNGPSLKTQDLSVLKGKNTMFVNRGFMHPMYKELQPKYHVFLDSNIRDGVWPVSWLDEIFALSPNVRIIMPVSWYHHPTFSDYKDDERIYWLDWHVPFYTLGVSGGCFSYAIHQKFENIYFTGFDANSCAFDMIKSSESHFYGSDPELSEMTSMQHSMALMSTAIHFYSLNKLAAYCKKKHINIFNMTNGGLIDMFPRKQFPTIK